MEDDTTLFPKLMYSLGTENCAQYGNLSSSLSAFMIIS